MASDTRVSAGSGSSPDVTASRSIDWRALWDRHHLSAATLGCLLFLILGRIADTQGGGNVAIALYVAAYISGGTASLISGIRTLAERRIDVDLLMVLAAVAAAVIGEWVEGGTLLFLFSLSNALQHYALDRTRRAITSLMKLRPQKALRKEENGEERLVPIEELRIGDLIVVLPGELIPIDGVIAEGFSSINEASITGESIPVDKGPGDEVFGGTLNQLGSLEVRVAKPAQETVIAKIIQMVEEAQEHEAPTQRTIDTIEQYYAVGVIAVTLLAAFLPIAFGADRSDSIYRAITLMVVASPCAVAMAVPAPMVAAIANAARSGILFKGGNYIESMSEVDVIALDKTGTLTEGRPRVTDIVPSPGESESSVLTMAASIESRSEHPLAQAILHAAADAEISYAEAENIRAVPGQGVIGTLHGDEVWIGNRRLLTDRLGSIDAEIADRARRLEEEGKTVMFLGSDRLIGLIAVTDRIRPSAARAIARLKASGIRRVVMLTGDNHRVAEAVAREAGVDEVHAQLLPEEKVKVLESLMRHHSVAMVGDGVNDAPALAMATVGIAMGAAGTDVALETADVVLMSNDLDKLNHAVALSRRAKRIVWQNLIFALGVIALLVLAVLTRGLVLAVGVIGHEGSTVLVIFNSLRLLFGRHRPFASPGESVPA